jgi:hypothetical protein
MYLERVINWGLKKFKMAAIAMVTKVQKMLNSNRTADPFETFFFLDYKYDIFNLRKPRSMVTLINES